MTDPVAAARSGSHGARARLTTTTADGVLIRTYQTPSVVLSGGVSFDRSRQVRRSVTLSVVDRDGVMAPSEMTDEFAPGHRVRVERGVVSAGVVVWVPLGVYVITSFDSKMKGTLDIRGFDPTVELEQEFGEPVVIPSRTRAREALRSIWEPVLGPGGGWPLDDDSATFASARVLADDDERLDAGVSMMVGFGLEVYADRAGVPVLAPLGDPNDATVTRTLVQDAGRAVAVSVSRSADLRPYNRQVVIAEPSDAPVIRGEALITDRTHPFHPDRIGLRTAPTYRTASIGTQRAAVTLAKALLIERTLWTDTVEWEGVPDLELEAGDIVRIVESRTRTDAKYRVESLSVPVGLGSMSMVASRVQPMF